VDAIACRILTTSSLETSLFTSSFSSLVSLKNKPQLQNSIPKNSQTEVQAELIRKITCDLKHQSPLHRFVDYRRRRWKKPQVVAANFPVVASPS